MSQNSDKLNEDIKYLIRRSKELSFLIKDAKYVDAYHKSLGINQKLADIQLRLESGEMNICDTNCEKQNNNEKMIKYGNTKENVV